VKKRPNISGGVDNLRSQGFEKDISDQIINNSRSMISIINRKYIYQKVNTTFCNSLQVMNDSIVGKSLSDVWGLETFKKAIKNNIDLCFSGKTVKYETSFDTPQRGERYYEVVFRPLSVETGEVVYLLAETFDVDDIRRLKQIAIEKEEEFRNLETNLPIGFLRCDPEGRILNANKAFLKIMECHDDVSITKMNLKYFYPDEELFEMHFRQLLKCNTLTFGLIPLKNFRGNEIPCRLNGFLAIDASGNPSFIDFAIEDSSRELILENRLLQAQKLETIGALAGGIAHDFNNILSTIYGYSEMLQEDLHEGSELSEKVSKIQGAVLKARSITNQILTFSRQVEQEKISISISEVLKETIGFVKSAIPPNIIVKSHIPKNDPYVFADPTQLFRVFLNLMTNAIQSMEDEGGTLSVNLATVEGKQIQHELNKDIVADEYVLLTFRDTGKGMESSLLGRIFEPFFTTRQVGKGTGMGLSVVHGIISELEGEILVSSKKGKGSVFYIYLPISKDYLDLKGKTIKRKKILFITGNKYESRILSLALENTGYELIYVSDRSNLTKVMASINERPDLVIYMNDSTKIQTDDLVGVFTSLEIKLPCILITDPVRGLLEEKLLSSGIIKQHLIKPVSLREIRNAIQISLR
jgi:signal transduction histidine kinase